MSKKVGNIIIIFNLLLLVSCADLLTKRSFVDEMERESDGLFVPGRDFKYISGDSGSAYRSRKEILDRTPATAREIERRGQSKSLEAELRRLENSLSSKEFISYQKRKKYLDGISQKIYYLQLSRSEKEEYLAGSVIGRHSTREVSRNINQSPLNMVMDHKRNEKNLYLGMNKNSVERSWGTPARIDIAGNPRNQNERWTFYDGRRVKKIFFENGLVGGWTTD